MHRDNKAAFTGRMFMHYMESDLPNMYHKHLLLKLTQPPQATQAIHI